MAGTKRFQAAVVGASAGAIDALSVLLPPLQRDYPLPLFAVVHLPPQRESGLPELFRNKCALRVKEAEDKEPAEPGTLYFAPPDYHLLLENDCRLALSQDEPVCYSRPSIDVLFESAAEVYGEALLAVVLTGANKDGASGTKKICEAGGTALVQAPRASPAPQMPQAAIASCPGALVMGLPEIREYLTALGRRENA